MFKFFFALVAVVTMMSMNIVGKLGTTTPVSAAAVKPAPVIIESNGSLSFPGRIPAPDTIYELRRAIQSEDVETMNALLFENHLFMAPNN
ncbi:MAG: hypothetical protein GXP30_02900 [Verrucomicrobia bacterium]|nr:hypothetical protein [Verrucomicrobiota bacterium]